MLAGRLTKHNHRLEGNVSVPPKSSLFDSRGLTYWQMYVVKEELEKKIDGTRKIFLMENAKGVEHFKKFEEAINGLVKSVTQAHNRVDNRALTKRVAKLEERCDTLTG